MFFKSLIIIPCYDEAPRLPVAEFLDYTGEEPDVMLLFVNDGSKDRTIDVLQDIQRQRDNVSVLDNKQNSGKAEAIRSGVRYALEHFPFEYIGFFDADLATPLYEINNLEKIADEKKSLMVACSRIKRLGSVIDRKLTRHLMGRVFATCASYILMLPVYDTQCGAKIIRKDAARLIFEKPFNSRWFFDIELFARIILNYGYQAALENIYEYPMLEWVEKGDSRIRFKDLLRTPLQLLKLNRIYRQQIKQKRG